MPTPEIAPVPLLHRSIGSVRTTFVIEENQARIEPEGGLHKGVPLHLHRTEDEAWYVLEGTLRFHYGAREFNAGAGEGVLLPRGPAHTFWNPGPEPARYLLIVGPRTAGLLEALHGPHRPEPSGLKELYASFEVELLE
jgi:mannose-6-phosphate isomerase-like protein (cupin superfamily)